MVATGVTVPMPRSSTAMSPLVTLATPTGVGGVSGVGFLCPKISRQTKTATTNTTSAISSQRSQASPRRYSGRRGGGASAGGGAPAWPDGLLHGRPRSESVN